MKRLILAMLAGTCITSVAAAADLAVRKAQPYAAPVAAVPIWTGIYIGGHFGSGWGTVEKSLTEVVVGNQTLGGFDIPLASYNVNGFLAGVQGGFNIQMGWVVLGVEGEYSWSGNIDGKAPCVLVLACETKVDWIGTVAGRAGFTADRAFIYGKAGVAFTDSNYLASLTLGNNLNADFSTSVSDVRYGILWGAGIEYAITSNLSAKLEYNYADFGTETYHLPFAIGKTPVDPTVDVSQNLHIVKLGVNYRFGGGLAPAPVMANY
jgi:outer membrane immunogenic protein